MRSGLVTVVGRPNVGKSSLVNALVGRKVSIVSHKPQTTRHRIQGVVNRAEGQLVFVDTPGLHLRATRRLNTMMNDAAAGALADVDVVLFVIEAGRWTEEDEAVLTRLSTLPMPVGLVVNKVDRITDKARLLPLLAEAAARHPFAFVVPLSAMKRQNLQPLVDELMSRMPEGPALYPEDQVVGYDDAFGLAELIREKLVRNLHQELPYATTVAIESFEQEGRLDRVHAVIWVEREGQKGIVVGEKGEQLRKIGEAARREWERQQGRKLYLKLWCKVRENWSDDLRALRQFGISGE
jgi:GTPase